MLWKHYTDSYFGGDSLNIYFQNSIIQQLFNHNIFFLKIQFTNGDVLRLF